jgi:hypothetical protein
MLLLIGPSGCAPLPDLSPYAAATGAVRQSAQAAGNSIAAEFDNFDKVDTDSADVKTLKSEFAAAWDVNLKALNALQRYADSLDAIADAGNEGEKSALKVADQVQALAGSLGIAVAPAVGTVADVGAKLFGQLQRIRAAKSLKASLSAADPAIRELEPTLAKNVDLARRVFVQLIQAQQKVLNTATTGNYGNFTTAAESLTETENIIILQLAAAPMGPKAAVLRSQLNEIAQVRTAIAPQIAEYAAKNTALENRKRAGLALFGALRDALAAWTEAHSALVDAVNNHRPVTFESLQDAIVTVRQELQELRKL